MFRLALRTTIVAHLIPVKVDTHSDLASGFKEVAKLWPMSGNNQALTASVLQSVVAALHFSKSAFLEELAKEDGFKCLQTKYQPLGTMVRGMCIAGTHRPVWSQVNVDPRTPPKGIFEICNVLCKLPGNLSLAAPQCDDKTEYV